MREIFDVCSKNKRKQSHIHDEKYEFEINQIAHRLHVSIENVENSLIMLRELREIKYESKDEAFCFRINCAKAKEVLSENDTNDGLTEICTKLLNKMKDLEKVNLSKLENMYNMSISHLITDAESHNTKSFDEKVKLLQQSIENYFSDSAGKNCPNHAKKLIKSEPTDMERSHMLGDMGTLMRRNGTALIPNGKVLARILHGISTPGYNAQQWAGCGYWGRYKSVDFNVLIQMAMKFFISFKKMDK